MEGRNRNRSVCKICGVAASYSYYGAIACESCKVFFKRNAENQKKTLKCHFDDQCEVNRCNRHVCSACRLAKCFQVGMCTEMIRSSYPKRMEKVNTLPKSVQIKSWKDKCPQQISTLNLLEQDRSLLNSDQWTHLSNLIHCYDEHNVLPAAKDFLKELDSLQPKLRFKIDSKRILDIITIICQTIEPFIQSNHDFASLPLHHRSIVLRGSVENVGCLSTCFIMRQSGLITNSAFCNGLEITYGTLPYNLSLNLTSLLDPDVNLVKLTLALLAFCPSNCTLFNENASPSHLIDIQAFLHIQNSYAELIWKYLLYTYTFEQAVLRFSHLVKCLVATFTVRTHLQTVTNHIDVVESLVQKIEQRQMNIEDN
ncbi:unnamed protein product [Rotaria sordida]|uniref:Nuclear receptor domain-containing protein n=1 Tax=Rotaria sordida TaxID=392033 RepID=A0A814P1P3_9BILA|nr:unnamed protein product [Rotaria sordida]